MEEGGVGHVFLLYLRLGAPCCHTTLAPADGGQSLDVALETQVWGRVF